MSFRRLDVKQTQEIFARLLSYNGPVTNFERGEPISMLKRPLPLLDPQTQNSRQAVVPVKVLVSDAILDCAFVNIKPLISRLLFKTQDGDKYKLDMLAQSGGPMMQHSMFWDLICVLVASKFALSFSGLVALDFENIDATMTGMIEDAITLLRSRTPAPTMSPTTKGLYTILGYDSVFAEKVIPVRSTDYKDAVHLWNELVSICSLIALKELQFDDPCSTRLFALMTDKSSMLSTPWIEAIFDKFTLATTKIFLAQPMEDTHLTHYNAAIQELGSSRFRILFPTDQEVRLFYNNAKILTPAASSIYALGIKLGNGSYGTVRSAQRKPTLLLPQAYQLAIKNVSLSRLETSKFREIYIWNKLASRNPSNYISKIEDFGFVLSNDLDQFPAFQDDILKVGMGYFISNRGLPFNKAYKEMASYARDTQSGLASDEINPWYFQFCIRCLAHIIAGLKHMKKLNIIHFDLKDPNMIFDYTNGYVQLTDFGSAVPLDPSMYGSKLEDWELAGQFDTISTLWFKAPEAILGTHGPILSVGPWSDMWSVGCVAYQLFHPKNEYAFPGQDESAYSQLIAIFQRLGTPAADTALMQHYDAESNDPSVSKFPKFKRKAKILGSETLETEDFLGLSNLQRVEEFLSKCFDFDTNTRITPDQALDTNLINLVRSPLGPISPPDGILNAGLKTGWNLVMK